MNTEKTQITQNTKNSNNSNNTKKFRSKESDHASRSWKRFFLIYAVIVLADIAVLSIEGHDSLREITKPLILIALMLFFIRKTYPVNRKRERLFLAGLFFSFLGDGFLNYEGYFLAGLFSFFTAHLMYFGAFLRYGGLSGIIRSPLTYLTLAYALGVFLYLSPYLGALKPYVVLYMFILVFLMTSLMSRRTRVSRFTYTSGLAGGILFMISDSILAVSKFAYSFPLSAQLIMITYAVAQLLLTRSFLEEEREFKADLQ